MTRFRQRLLAVALLALAGLAGWYSAGGLDMLRRGGATPSGDTVISGEQVLALSFRDTEEQVQSLGQWRGKILVVNFWATWCAPCRHEIPDFAQASREYQAREVQFVGLGIDSAANIARFREELSVPYPLLVGGTGSLPIMEGLGNPSLGLPFTLILDRGGQIRVRRLGPMTRTMLVETLEALLADRLPQG